MTGQVASERMDANRDGDSVPRRCGALLLAVRAPAATSARAEAARQAAAGEGASAPASPVVATPAAAPIAKPAAAVARRDAAPEEPGARELQADDEVNGDLPAETVELTAPADTAAADAAYAASLLHEALDSYQSAGTVLEGGGRDRGDRGARPRLRADGEDLRHLGGRPAAGAGEGEPAPADLAPDRRDLRRRGKSARRRHRQARSRA